MGELYLYTLGDGRIAAFDCEQTDVASTHRYRNPQYVRRLAWPLGETPVGRLALALFAVFFIARSPIEEGRRRLFSSRVLVR